MAKTTRKTAPVSNHPPVELAIVGSVGLDTIETPVTLKERVLGGSASYACAAASFFTQVGMVGVVGTDFPKRYLNLYRQFGIEDQGWVAWFVIAALKNRPISIYGDGKQVRDVLFIDDLLDAYEAACAQIDVTAGRIYNVGGGPENTMSIWAEFGPILAELLGREVPVRFADWRPGDQRVYVSDIRKAAAEMGWRPRVSVREGVTRLYHWISANQALFAHL